jgi:integral membrane protein (TIGR01906 family)
MRGQTNTDDRLTVTARSLSGPAANPIRTGVLVLLVVAMPVFLITLGLRIAFNSSWLYNYSFSHYSADKVTGIDIEQLKTAGKDIRSYFNDDRELLDTTVVVAGVKDPLFNQREILHMKDVKDLVRGLVYGGLWASGIYFLVFIVCAYALWKNRMPIALAKGLLWGSALTALLLLVTGLAVLVGFDAVFTQFHVISFSNTLWQLDPSRDHLLQMFPQEFFRDAVLMVAGGCLLASLIIGGLTYQGLKRRHERLAVWTD